jgi:hypothetical protein
MRLNAKERGLVPLLSPFRGVESYRWRVHSAFDSCLTNEIVGRLDEGQSGRAGGSVNE